MEIQDLLKLETKVINNRVVFKFTYTELPITQLRTLKTIEVMEGVLKSLSKKEVNKACFVFIVNSLDFNVNIKLFQEFGSIFRSYTDIITEKLDFTIIQTNNGIFKVFFSLLKRFYEPIRPLYICENDEIVNNCLKSDEEINKKCNLSERIKQDNRC